MSRFRKVLLGIIGVELVVLAAFYLGAPDTQPQEQNVQVIEVPQGTLSGLMPETPYVTPMPTYPAASTPHSQIKWEPLVRSNSLNVEVAPSTITILPMARGYEVTAMFKMSFAEEMAIKGKKKKVAYYVNKMTVTCADQNMRVDESTVYSKDNEKLTEAKNLGVLKNKNDPNSFVTVWAALACQGVQDRKPGKVV